MVSSHPLHFLGLTLFLARTRSKVEMRNRIYRQWNEHLLFQKGKESYVRTTNDSNQTVVLSEAQSYGMLHYRCSRRKRTSPTSRL